MHSNLLIKILTLKVSRNVHFSFDNLYKISETTQTIEIEYESSF